MVRDVLTAERRDGVESLMRSDEDIVFEGKMSDCHVENPE